MIPANDWWGVIQHYNLSVFPAQLIFYILVITCMVVYIMAIKPASHLLKIFLMIAFGWIGIVFFTIQGQQLPAHNAQAFLFITLAVLFLIDFLVGNGDFRLPEKGMQRTMTLMGFGLVLAYPLIGLLAGRPLSKCIVPGSFPCPTTAFALLLMVNREPARKFWLYIITMFFLLLWAIPFPLMIQLPKFGVYEDSIMLMAGIYALVCLFQDRKIRT